VKTSTDGEYAWSDGKILPASSSLWARGQPDSQGTVYCGAIIARQLPDQEKELGVDDYPCTGPIGFICHRYV